ncbi:hypothetical protein G3H63_02815 [Microbacterium resistens]|uniref:FtsX-like permease family protein n=1 Tax=Microbacterium resistens TaxID=156977 RepID=UPI001C57AB79|nr:FtsX-like permease family protein [Microbacterium resistens]MBW1638016.1 hypothetical protein [Microbacterium resistens]
MIRLTVADLVRQARIWSGLFLLTIVVGFVAGFAAMLVETGLVQGGAVRQTLDGASSMVLVFTGISAVVVIAGAANLTVALQQRGYALWQVVGVSPSRVGVVVRAQLGLVGIGGGLLGCALTTTVMRPLFAYFFQTWGDEVLSTPLRLGPVSFLCVGVGVGVLCMAGGHRAARRASRVPPVEALREPEPPRVRMGVLRGVLVVATLGGVTALAWRLGDGDFSSIVNRGMFLTPAVVALMAAWGPVLYPAAQRIWSALVPARMSGAWFLARHDARSRVSQSTAVIAPLMVAIALVGGLYSGAATLGAAAPAWTGQQGDWTIQTEAVAVMLGGPLLVGTTGAAVAVFMASGARERQVALLQAAGADRGVILRAAWGEATIHAATAVLLGAAATVIGSGFLAAGLGLSAPIVAWGPILLVGAVGAGLITLATLVPTAAALRMPVSRVLAAE